MSERESEVGILVELLTAVAVTWAETSLSSFSCVSVIIGFSGRGQWWRANILENNCIRLDKQVQKVSN